MRYGKKAGKMQLNFFVTLSRNGGGVGHCGRRDSSSLPCYFYEKNSRLQIGLSSLSGALH
jgi:hypothetical protein